MSDIVAQLRDRSLVAEQDGEPLSLLDEAADEITSLRSRPCPYVTGTVTHYCTLTQFTLTDEEREAVASAIRWCEMDSEADGDVVSQYCAARAATLRGLLERTGEK